MINLLEVICVVDINLSYFINLLSIYLKCNIGEDIKIDKIWFLFLRCV